MTSTASHTHFPDLFHNRPFMHLWVGETASQIGFQVASLATSAIAITVLSASSEQVGVLNALQTIAFLLIGLPAGAWIDHWYKRRVMIVADLVRVVALASIPIAWWLGSLTLIHLMIVVTIMSFASVFFDVSYQSYVPSIVSRMQIGDANGRLEASYQVSRIAGPGLGGWLIGVLAAPLTYLLTALTYAISAVAIWTIPGKEAAPVSAQGEKLWPQIKAGIDYVRGERLLGPLFLCISFGAFASQGVQTLLPLFALRELGMTATALGALLSIGAIGGILGAIVRPRIVARFGEGHSLTAANIIGNLALFGMLFCVVWPQHASFILIAANVFSSFFVTIFNVTQMSLRQQICPLPLMGRLNATFRFAVWGMMPIGSFLAGLLAGRAGVAIALAVFIALGVCAGIAMAFTPVARRNRITIAAD